MQDVRSHPAHELTSATHCTIAAAGTDRGEGPYPRPVACPSPTLDLSRCAQAAGVRPPCTDCGETAHWRVDLSEVGIGSCPSASPTLNSACRMQTAGVCIAARDGRENTPCWRVTLPEDIAAPAHDPARIAHSAGVELTGTDGSEDPGGGICLAPVNGELVFDRGVRISTPARDLACSAKATSVPAPSTDRYEALRLRYDRDLRAAQPAAYAGANWEVARRRGDALAICRRECEFDPAVVPQSRVDPANLHAVYLYRAAVQPTVYLCVGGEVAGARQDSLSAGGLPAELRSAVVESLRDDAACLLVVALRVRDPCRPSRRQCQQRRQSQQQRFS